MRFSMKYFVICFLFVGLHCFSQTTIKKLDGSTITSKQIDRIVEKLMVYGKVDGLALSVVNGNKAYVKTYGYRNKETKELLDPISVMYAASFTKAVFAYLTMKLVEDEKLELDKPLYQYLGKPIAEYPDWKALDTDENWKLITPRMCLSHTTGLPNTRWINVRTGEEDTLGPLKIYFKPGTRYAYSGEGLKLLQLVEEKITGKTIEELAAAYIFKPFGMTRTGFIWHSEFDSNYAIGHDEKGNLVPKKKRSLGNAAGSMVTTIADYTRFIQKILLNYGLDPKLRNEMIRPQIAIDSKYQFPTITDETTDENKDILLSYALGWGFFKGKYGRAFFKEGHDDAWRHYNVNFPDKNMAIVIMTNSANGESVFKELLEKVIGDTETPWEWERYIPYNFKR